MGTAVTTMATLGLTHVDGGVGNRGVGPSSGTLLCHIRSGEDDVRCTPTVYLCTHIRSGDARGVYDGGSSAHCEVIANVCGVSNE